MKKRGVIYVATGKGYTNMALASAQTVKQWHPTLAIHLFTDQKRIQSSFIDSYALIENPNRRSKIEYLQQSPFEETLFLDADTRLIHSLGDIFDWLNRHDVVMAHAQRRNTFATNQTWKADVSNTYVQFNSGIIVYRNTQKLRQLFTAWQQAYTKTAFRLDQVTLRELCWESGLSIGILPPYYNIRDEKYIDFWQKQGHPVKLLHLDSYKRNFDIPTTIKKQRSFLGRINYLIGAVRWIIRQPLSWKFKLLRHD